jgi:hypothetical protein
MNNLQNPPKYDIIPYLSVQIKSDKYKDIIYNYSNLEINKSEEGASLIPLSYSYNIISGTLDDASKGDFEKVVASILFDVMKNLEKQQRE